MRLDGTRLKAFWGNPERYRIAYQCDIVPASTSYGLMRGIVFHTALNLAARGQDLTTIHAVVSGILPDYDGRMITGMSPQAIANGLSMAEAYMSLSQDYEVLASELEFDFEIVGSEHRGVGRIDQIVRDSKGKQWVLEFKTGSPKTQWSRKIDEWASDMQADFELLGSAQLGYEVQGVRVQYVLELTPPRVWQPIYVTRSEAALKRSQLFIHQTCETIEMYRATFGLEQPWPHLSNWPCNGDCGYCGYQGVCGRQGPLVPEDIEGMKRREEHLELLRVVA